MSLPASDLTDWELMQRLQRRSKVPDYEALAEAVSRGLAEDPARRARVEAENQVIDEIAARAHADLRRIWSPLENVYRERRLWLYVMLAQRDLGADIPQWAIDASADNLNPGADVLERIKQREFQTRHDLKARLEIFCEDAGHQFHHLGVTSADVVENVYQWRVRDSLVWLGSAWGHRFDLEHYPLRGIKGPVGTQQDQAEFLGSVDAAVELDDRIRDYLQFPSVAISPPQVMFRSLDAGVVTELLSVATARSRASGRPLCAVLSGFATMAAAIAGDTWNEGDVASSVVRRYCLQGSIFAFDVAMRGWILEH